MFTPDWQKAEDYNYIDELSLDALAFEFLRRNPGYIEDYQKFAEIEEELTTKFGPKKSNYESWKAAGKAIGDIWDPPRDPGESLKAYLQRTIDCAYDPKPTCYKEWFQRKWGLEGGFPPPFEPTTCDVVNLFVTTQLSNFS